MFLSTMSIKRPVMTTMILSVFLIFGAIAYFSLNLNLQPDVELPYITISTVYPGAGPKEVETLISKRIEETVSTISQLKRIESYSLDGLSIVILEFKLGKNVDVASQETKDKIDLIINNLPTDAKQPIVQKVDFRQIPVVQVMLSGDLSPRELWDIADKTLKDRFSQISGVAKVNITGGQEREIRVSLDNKTAYENNISLAQLMGILKMYNMDIPGGYFKLNDQEYTVRLEGEFPDVETMREIQVPTAFGPKKLRQFADVQDAGKDIRQRAVYFDNINKVKDNNAVRLGIVKSTEGNIVEVANSVRKTLPDIQASLPKGVKIEIVDDASTFVKSAVDDTMSNVYLGVIFTGLVLLLFLHDWRSTLIVALSMPTSIISTFLLLQMWGLTLNMMTLMGLSVSVGVLVANSIVVLENIFRYKSMGKDNKEASIKGTDEVVLPVLAATLTNLVVFLPIAAMSSMVGMWLRELALATVFATLFSLLMSFTLTPMLASLFIKEEHHQRKWAYYIIKWEDFSTRFYSRTLAYVLRNKKTSWLTIGATVFAFFVVMFVFGPKIGFDFLPTVDDGKIKIEVELPEGFNLDETANTLNIIQNKLKNHKEITHIITDLGKKSDLDIGTNLAALTVQLVDAEKRETKMPEMIQMFVNELADVPNAKIKIDVASRMSGLGAPVTFYLLGQDLDKLEVLKNEIMDKIRDVPGLQNLDQSSRAGKPEITVYPNREKLIETGLSTMDVALTLRSSVEGMVSSKYREYGNEYDITVTLNDESVNGPEKIGNITVVSPIAGAMRLSQLADIKFTTGYTKILHREKFTTIMFSGSPAAGVPLGDVTNEINKRLETISFPPGYSIKWGGNVELMNDMVKDMIFAFFLAVLLTYMLMAAMLESFWQPLLIMFTVLLGMIGVILSLYITNISFSVTSLMSIVMLIGIVVNNAILLLDHANQLKREQGYTPKDALLEAGPLKLKPQIMSSVAIILGMLPMAVGIGAAGKEMRTPMGIVAVGGLIVSTILTLYVIPAIYYVASKVKVKKETA